MTLDKILIQLDADNQVSVFDSVVAVDAGVDQLFRHGGVKPDQVRGLVHGAMFTRGPKQLSNTAIFIGGSDVSLGESLLDKALESFFGPIRVSVMLDPNGANTTSAAAVLAATQHLDLPGTTALVLAATGPVGARVTRLLAREGATVRAASRKLDRAEALAERVSSSVEQSKISPVEIVDVGALEQALVGVQLVVSAGAAGVSLLPRQVREAAEDLKVAIDLNAVPPEGIEGIEVTDRAKLREGVTCYGAIGVGGTKMKIHKAAIQRLFEANDLVLDAEQIFELGQNLD